MNKIFSIKTYFIFFTLTLATSFTTGTLPHLEASPRSPQEYTLLSSQAIESKVERIAERLQLTQEQRTTLLLLSEEIETHWEEWMQQDEPSNHSSTVKLVFFGDHTLTIHPSAGEVCIYLEGHAKVLGQGAFKIVKKAISYTREDEVAVATPLNGFYEEGSSDFYMTTDSSDWTTSEDYWSSSYSDTDTYSDTYTYSGEFTTGTGSEDDWIAEDYAREANILEKVQDCPTVIQIYFISFDWQEQLQQYLPTIVGKYYNGGTFSSEYSKYASYPIEDKLRICHDLFLALSHVHALNITHNDLHGGNILLQKQRVENGNQTKTVSNIQGAYLSDFGLAKIYKNSDDLYFKARAHYDKIYLTWGLGELFSSHQEAGKVDHLMLQLLLSAQDPEISTEQLYNQFVTLLPELVDEETAERVMQNALQPKRMKTQKENLVEWK